MSESAKPSQAEEEYLAAYREARRRLGSNQPLSTILRVAAMIQKRTRDRGNPCFGSKQNSARDRRKVF